MRLRMWNTQSWHIKCSIRKSSRISMDFPWICHRNELMSSRPRPHPTHDSLCREPTPQSSQSRPLWSFPAASGVGIYPQQRDNNTHTACLWYKKTCYIPYHIRYPKKNTIIKNSLSFTEGLVALWHFGRYLREAWLHFQDSLEQSWIHIFNPGCNGGFCGDISIYVSYIHIIINIIRILM